MQAKHPGRDIIVIGASVGGIDALSAIVGALPRDIPAAIFIAIHLSPSFSSRLPEILESVGKLPARLALHEEVIQHGRIYVAPADNHLTLRFGHCRVVRGPKENGHRPSVDALFRTASAAYGPRVAAVVLTGTMDCGTAGLLSVRARGGIAVVQHPEEAVAKEMPESAIRHASIDHIERLGDMGALLDRLSREPAGEWPSNVPRAIRELEGDEPGAPLEAVCPLCDGVLTETRIGQYHSFRCHVGHTFSLASLAAEQAESVERALWASVRALEESARLAARLAAGTVGEMRRRYEEREQSLLEQAEVLRKLLLHGERLANAPSRDVSFERTK